MTRLVGEVQPRGPHHRGRLRCGVLHLLWSGWTDDDILILYFKRHLNNLPGHQSRGTVENGEFINWHPNSRFLPWFSDFQLMLRELIKGNESVVIGWRGYGPRPIDGVVDPL
jgi:hypothetical protein